jgi:hypothetical protein
MRQYSRLSNCHVQELLHVSIVLIVLVILPTAAAQAKLQSDSASPVPFTEAEKNEAAKRGQYSDALYSFAVSGRSYEVTGRGLVSVRSSGSHTVLAKAPLDFPEAALISGIRYVIFKGDLILNYDVTLLKRPIQERDRIVEEDVLQGRVARFDPRTLKSKWVSISARTDPGPPIVSHGSMFVSGTGMIGEIDLGTGICLWLHDSLQSNVGKYLAFAVPRIVGDYVFFEEDRAFLRSRSPETIQVKRRTGEIITMSYQPGP